MQTSVVAVVLSRWAFSIFSKSRLTKTSYSIAFKKLLHVMSNRLTSAQVPGLITPVDRRKAEELSARLSQLTARQKEVLDLLLAGRTLKEIAIHFQITVQAPGNTNKRFLRSLVSRTEWN